MWPDVPQRQYDSFPPETQRQIDARIDLIRDDPESYGSYDMATDQWTTTFGDGMRFITYAVVQRNVTIIVLRLVAL